MDQFPLESGGILLYLVRGPVGLAGTRPHRIQAHCSGQRQFAQALPVFRHLFQLPGQTDPGKHPDQLIPAAFEDKQAGQPGARENQYRLACSFEATGLADMEEVFGPFDHAQPAPA